MKISVLDMNDNIVAFEVSDDMLVEDLKALVEIEVNLQNLIYIHI